VHAYKILVGRPEAKIPLNIKMDLEVLGFENVDWIHLAQITVSC